MAANTGNPKATFKQTTKTGLEIPIPTRGEVMEFIDKVANPAGRKRPAGKARPPKQSR